VIVAAIDLLLGASSTTAPMAQAGTTRRVEVGVLGPMQLVGPDGPVDVRPGLSRVLLTALVARAGHSVATDVLIEQIWSDHLPANPANALQVQVSYLRSRMRDAGDGIRIDRDGPGYRLVIDHGDIDAQRFERTVHEVAAALPRSASIADAELLLASVEEALATWRGAPFADTMYLPFTGAEIARLEELRLVAFEQRAELLDLLGRHGEAVAWLRPLVGEHPLREQLWILLVTSLYRNGRQAEALRAFARARDLLIDELGISPGPELQVLEQRILNQDPEPTWTPMPDSEGVPPGDARGVAPAPVVPSPRRRPIPASISPLIGRRWEVDAVGDLLRSERLLTLVGPGSVRLFVERAQATNPRFELNDDNATAVGAICCALDGLPLAIELAAARTSLLSPAAVLERLEDRFALLTRGGRDAESRQRSLRATLEWSVDLLDAEEAVDALDSLAALVDRSLVVATGDDRYLLLDTVRAFALELLEQAGPVAVADHHRRHAAWYTEVAYFCDPAGHGPLPRAWPRLRAEAANLRAAVHWSFGTGGDIARGARLVGSLAGSMVLDGAFAEIDEWLGWAIQAEIADGDAAKVLRGMAVVALYQGRFPDSVAAARASLSRAEAGNNPLIIASSSLTVGSALWGVGDLDGSAAMLRSAVDRFDAAGDVRGRGFALARLARTLTAAGDPTAVAVASAAVDDLEASNDDWMAVPALEHLACALWKAGDLDAAAGRAAEAVEAASRIGSYSGGLSALGLQGRIRLASGDLAGAEQAHLDTIDRASKVANAGIVADALEGIAEARSSNGDHATAAWALACAGAVRSEAGVPPAPAYRPLLEDLTARIRHALGDEHFARASHEGRRATPLDIVKRLRQE